MSRLSEQVRNTLVIGCLLCLLITTVSILGQMERTMVNLYHAPSSTYTHIAYRDPIPSMQDLAVQSIQYAYVDISEQLVPETIPTQIALATPPVQDDLSIYDLIAIEPAAGGDETPATSNMSKLPLPQNTSIFPMISDHLSPTDEQTGEGVTHHIATHFDTIHMQNVIIK